MKTRRLNKARIRRERRFVSEYKPPKLTQQELLCQESTQWAVDQQKRAMNSCGQHLGLGMGALGSALGGLFG